MASYGGFEPQRAHTLGALTSVYEATAADGRAGRFALKIFHPPPSSLVRRVLALEGWLLAAERQQAAARNGSVLEVLAWGRCEEGAFLVLPWRHASLEPLVESLRPKGDRLRELAHQLFAGLAGWEAAYGGPHGKLKRTNIFLEGSGALASRPALFSDPWYLPGVRVEELRRRDLAHVGEILVRVVRGRAAGGGPIEEAPEWTALGRAGPAWREYCNFLLNHQPASEPTLAEAKERLRRIPHDVQPVRNATRAAAAIVGLTGAGLLAFARFGNPDLLPERYLIVAEALGNPRAFRVEIAPEWAQLCRAWGTWIGDALRNVERWENTPGLWTEADPLRRALAAFRTQAEALDPRTVVPEAKGSSLGILADSPPENVRQELLRGSVDRRVQFAWLRVRALGAQMETWPRWTEFRTAVAQLQARGFPRVAATVNQRLPAGTAEEPPAVLWRSFNELSQDRDGLLALLPRWQAVETVAAELAGSGDRVQVALPRLTLTAVVDRASVGDFADNLTGPLAELRRRRAQFLAPTVSRERFLREAPVFAATTEVTAADVTTWENQLGDFSRVGPPDDPREVERWDDRFNRLRVAATDLEPEAPPAEPGLRSLGRADFDSELARSSGELTGLRAREVLRVDLPAVATELARFRAAFEALEQGVDSTLALLRPELWLQRTAATTWRYPAVTAQWNAWRERDLAGVTAASLEQDRARFRQIRAQARAVREWLQDLEGAPGLGGLEIPSLDATTPATRTALQAWIQRRGNQAATAVLNAADWNGDRPASSWALAVARPAVRAPIDSLRRWLAGLPEVAADLDQLGALLEAGYGWEEGVPAARARLNPRADLGELTGRPVLWLTEARQLESLTQANDRSTLMAAAQAEGLASKLTAWRRLGALADWPAGTADLDADGGLVSAMRERIQTLVPEGARRTALQEELARETRRRWNRAARQASRDEAALAQTFERMERFGIAQSDLEPSVGYNLRLWQLKREEGETDDLDRVRAQRDAFVAAVRRAPEVAADAGVARLVNALDALPLRDDASRPSSQSPRRAGWTERSAEGGQRLTVSWTSQSRRVELDYQLVQPTDGTPPFYLARREIAVGEFIDLLAAHAAGSAVLESMPAWVRREGDASEPWTAPMAWRPRSDRKGVELNPTWIYRPDAQVAPLLAPAQAKVAALEELHGERPTARSPLQRISPEGARLFAERVLGARLPTPAEWRALMQSGVPKMGTNVRDQRFAELWSYLDGYRVANQTIAWRPNQGIFLPLEPLAVGARTRRVPLRDSGEAYAGTADGHLWLAPVDEGPEINGFIHLLGNVWIYLFEPAEKQFYVSAGSALSPPSLDPQAVQRVEGVPLIGSRRGRALVDGFSDVGLRPAFDAPPGLRDRLEMLRLVRVQQFLTL